MSVKRRPERNGGCWTCKLRRKKCDESRPTCGDCKSLEISCTYGPKPSWMDGGDGQRRKTLALKNEIKRKAIHRREKANASNKSALDNDTPHFSIISDMITSKNKFSISDSGSTLLDNQERTIAQSKSPYESMQSITNFDNHLEHQCLNGIDSSPGLEIDFVMKYLDFVFPSLFPFYRPTLFETGRSWILALLGKSKIAYHSAVSLTCYFFTMALSDGEIGAEHTDCKQTRWKEVEQQTNMCFGSLRSYMSARDLNSESTAATAIVKVNTLESVIHILIFEMALGKSAPWHSHLPPACALFEEIMASSNLSHQDSNQSKLASVLLEIGKPLWTRPGQLGHVWSPDQAGFRFCAGFLIFIDIVASTAIRQAPRLLYHHSDILARIDDGYYAVSDAEVRLSGIVGCRNWVVKSIAEISNLDAQKQERLGRKNDPITESINHASEINDRLTSNIVNMQSELATSSPLVYNHRAPFDTNTDPSASLKSTLIWAHATQMYLEVVLHGWQLHRALIRENVVHVVGLLHTIPSHQLRALAWPLCVAGCLATEQEECEFRRLLSNQGKVHTAGALDDAIQIMEKVWEMRPTLDIATWNLASCFSILGSPILLA